MDPEVAGTLLTESDYELMGIRSEGEAVRDVRVIANPSGQGKDYLRIRGGKILIQRHSYANDLMARISQFFNQGPAPLSPSENQERRVWIEKMTKRSSRGEDLEILAARILTAGLPSC